MSRTHGRLSDPGKAPRTPRSPLREPGAVEHGPWRSPALDYCLGESLAQPLHVVAPPWGGWLRGVRDVDQFGSGVALPAAGSGFETIVEYQVPEGYAGVIRWWGADVDDVAAWEQVRWKLEAAGESKGRDYDRVGPFVGMRQDTMVPVYVQLLGGDVLRLRGKNAHAGDAYEACGRVKGWIWPERGEQR